MQRRVSRAEANGRIWLHSYMDIALYSRCCPLSFTIMILLQLLYSLCCIGLYCTVLCCLRVISCGERSTASTRVSVSNNQRDQGGRKRSGGEGWGGGGRGVRTWELQVGALPSQQTLRFLYLPSSVTRKQIGPGIQRSVAPGECVVYNYLFPVATDGCIRMLCVCCWWLDKLKE